jgi:signal transduction histidine kinase
VSTSVRLKVSLGVCLVAILLLGPFNWFQYQLQRRAAIADLRQLASTAGSLARQSLEEAMLANNRSAIQAILDNLAQVSEVQSTYLMTTESVVRASPASRDNGRTMDQRGAKCKSCHDFPAGSRPRSIVETDANRQAVFRTMTPIGNAPACQTCHPPQERLNGVFYMDLSMTGLSARLDRDLRTVFLGSGALIALSALAIYLLLSWLVINPMDQVVEAMRRFSRGDRAVRTAVRARDEVGLLASVFNDMADTIQTQEVQSDKLYSDLKAANDTRRQLLTSLTTAREEERKRLSREIHDDLGQLLTGLSLHLKLCDQAIPGEFDVAHAHLTKANELVRNTIDQSHRLVVELRPTVLDDYGLVPALQEELQQRLASVGIAARLEIEGNLDDLPAEIATAAFRIVQEALTNVIRHAKAQEVSIRVERRDEVLEATVEDDGVGFLDRDLTADATGRLPLGILGMQERAQALGGRLVVANRRPRGTRVALSLPLGRSEQ